MRKLREQLKQEQPQAVQEIRENVAEWEKDLKKALKSWRGRVAWRVNAIKVRAKEYIENAKAQNEKGENDGYTNTVGQGPDADDLLEYGARVGDEDEANKRPGRKRRGDDEGTK